MPALHVIDSTIEPVTSQQNIYFPPEISEEYLILLNVIM